MADSDNLRFTKLSLNNGAGSIPALGFGTLIPDPVATRVATKAALEAGFRLLDTSERYRTEKEVGEAMQEVIKEGSVKREDVVVVTKVWNTNHRPERVKPAFEASLKRLQVEFIDLYLIHTPFAFQPGEEQDPRDSSGNVIYDKTVTLLDTWRALEALVDEGKCNAIGLSDVNVAQAKAIFDAARIKPAVVHVEAHPYLPEWDLVNYCKQNGIVLQAFAALGHSSEPKLLDDPVVTAIAARVRKTPAQVLLAWAIQRGTALLTTSKTPARIKENFDVTAIPEDAMREITEGIKRRVRFNAVVETGIPGFIPQRELTMRKQSLQQAKSMFSPRMAWMGLFATLILCGEVIAQSKESAMVQHVSYRTVNVDGLSIFYREAGPPDAPTILLLHGLPSSSRMFEPLLARLGNQFHLVAPDYPGFGHSDAPTSKEFAYTFDNIAAIMDRFTETLHLSKYTLYMQDYGGPVGFRMALAHPNRIEALIVQDAVAHNEGLGANWAPRRAFWADRATHEAELRTNLLSLQTTRTRHIGSDPHPEKYDPDLWTDEFAFLSRPGEADIQSDLFYDYRTNVEAYPKWQAWMQKTQPRLLVLWGKHDLSFDLSEPGAYRRDIPTAQVHILDAGHFALDTAADEIADLVRRFMVVPPAGGPAPRIVIDPPLPEPLAHGRVIIKYRAENLRISPVFGAPAVGLWPPIGHIHVTVDDAPWRWADTSGEPIVLNGFPAGPHKVLIELVDSNHQTLDKGFVTFVIPQQSVPEDRH